MDVNTDRAVTMQADLRNAFNEPDFQMQLLALRQEGGLTRQHLIEAMRQAAFTAQSKVLRKYGFEANADGIHAMVRVLTMHFIRYERRPPEQARARAKAIVIGYQAWQSPSQVIPEPHISDAASTRAPDSDDDMSVLSDVGVDE